ncbi:MAG: class B sortase [Oscillospiraceae bacterium]|nr:class B sortase [Oscillospiraceae bacterium]
MGNMRKVLMLVLAVVFVASGALLLRQAGDYRQTQQSREQARQTAGLFQPEQTRLPEVQTPLDPLPPESEQPEQRPLEEQAAYLWDVNLAGLRQTNTDVLGWISIPGTQLDYPFLQGEDNQYYLNHTWQGKRNAAGSVFLECKVSSDFSDFNTIVYAHNMKNGSMFGSLRQYRTQSHYEANPYIYIIDDSGVRRYEIFAAFEAEVVGYTYRLDVNTPEKKQAFLDYSARRSVIETEIVPTVEDSVITLSTCTGNGYDHRWVVQGVLTGTFTAPEPSAPAAER